MGTIGIVVNPSSGKDVRRLVSQATVFDNNEKINIALRIIFGLKAFGDHKIYLMPDGYFLSQRIYDKLKRSGIHENVEILDMFVNEDHGDTTRFVQSVKEKGADLVVVLGGDGTSRAAAKQIGDMPIIPVSTGTNNVFPFMLEGTVVGFAAAAIAGKVVSKDDAAKRCKKISIYKNKVYTDLALIDAVISRRTYVGAKAIWELSDMEQVIVTQSHPGTIGFSALVGAYKLVRPSDNWGYILDLSEDGELYKGGISAGVIQSYKAKNGRKLHINEIYGFTAKNNGIVAVDGEREVPYKKGDLIELKIDWTGPYKVDVFKTVEIAQEKGFFKC